MLGKQLCIDIYIYLQPYYVAQAVLELMAIHPSESLSAKITGMDYYTQLRCF